MSVVGERARVRQPSAGRARSETAVPAVRPSAPIQMRALTTHHSLPAQASSFVGRGEQLDQVLAALSGHRIVTLAGPGGVGKTRLALRVAELAEFDYGEGAWFIELAGIDGSRVEEALLAALPFAGDGRADGGRRLLVVDNCEHVRPECADAVHRLVRRRPEVSVLATSRQRLEVAGEHVLHVEPLAVPGEDEVDSNVVEATEAVRLFVERARAALPHFRLDSSNLPAVAEICRKVDGLPLAIELAAARIAVLSPAELLARLGDPFRLLTDRSTVAPERHRSLKSALEWGQALLTGPEATLFARLSVFAGPWDVEAAEAVCGGAGLHEDDILDLLTALVAHSLVVVDRKGSETRFRMLGTVAQFAAAKLAESDATDDVFERHARWCLARAERAAGERVGSNPERWLDALEEDLPEFRAALRWARARERGDIVLALAGALSWFWETRGHLTEGVEWLRWAIAHGTDADPELRARALRGAGILTWLLGDAPAAVPLVDEALGLFREAGNEAEASGCVCTGAFHVCENPMHSLPIVEADLARIRCLDDPGRLAWSLVNAGVAHFFVSDGGGAKSCFEECLALPRETVDPEVVVDALLGLGRVSVLLGDLDTAQRLFVETSELTRASGDHEGCTAALCWLGEVHRTRGDYAAARAAIAEATAVANTAGLPLSVGRCQQFRGRVEAAEGNFQTARRLLARSLKAPGANQVSYHRVRGLHALADVAITNATTAGVTDLLDEANTLAATTGDRQGQALVLMSEARLLSQQGETDRAARCAHDALRLQERIGDVFGIIASLEILAELGAASGRSKVAARLFGAVEKAREARGCRRTLADEPARARRLPQVAALLGSGAWEAAVAEGSHLSTPEAVSYAVKGRGSKDRPAIGWNSLTRAEADIANLVAEGMSNREIGLRLLVSARTVETHLSHIYRKVPVANRRELARATRERNIAAQLGGQMGHPETSQN